MLPTSVKGVITISNNIKILLFVIIMFSNLLFFGMWLYKMMQEVRNTILMKMEKIYLYLFLCGDRNKLDKLKNQALIDEENENLREKYYTAVNKLKEVYKEGKLVLTHQTLERSLVYLNIDKYFQAIGLGKREIEEVEKRRFDRLAQGAKIKSNEKAKSEFTREFRKNMDLRKRTDGPIDPDAQLVIDDEYIEGLKKNKGKTAKIRPETGEKNYEESGYGDDTSHIYSSTKKLTTQGDFLDTEDGFVGDDTHKFGNTKDHLE